MSALARLWLVACLAGAAPAATALPTHGADAAPTGGRAVQRPAEGRVEGRVVDPGTGAGIGGVEVRLDGRAVGGTGDDGSFRIERVPAGRHRLQVALPGFEPSDPVTVIVEDGRPVRVDIEYRLSSVTRVVAALPVESVPDAAVSRTTLAGATIGGAVGGLEDVSRALQLRPGVIASQDDRNDLVVRGGSPIETGVVVDGFEVPTVSHFAQPGSSGGGISLLSPVAIGRATLHTGGFAVAHGEHASSMLDIDLREPRDEGAGGSVSAGAGGILALGEGRLPSGAWMLAARRSILEVAFQREELRAVPRYHDVVGRVEWTAGRHQLRALVIESAETADVTSVPGGDFDEMHEEQQVRVVGIGLRSAWGSRTTSSLSVSRSEWTLDAYGGAAESVDGYDRSREVEWRARGELRRRLAGVELLAGGTVKRAGLRFDIENGGYRNPWGYLVAPVFVHDARGLTDAGGYVELGGRFGRAWQATAGCRLDHWGGSGQTTVSPRAGLRYSASRAVALTLGGGLYRQAIPYVWSESDPANRALEPIRTWQGSFGVEAGARPGRVAVEAFLKRYDGYPVEPTAPARVLVSAATDYETPFVGRLVAGGRVRAAGVDAMVTSVPWHGLQASSGVSWWQVRQRGLDGAWRRADYDVRYQVRGWIAWRPSPRWHASALWRYSSGRPYTPFDLKLSTRLNTGRYDRTRVNAATAPPYHRLDARIDRVFTTRRAVVTAFAEVDNAYARDNLYLYSWSRTARAPRPVYQWGLTPVAGVRVDF